MTAPALMGAVLAGGSSTRMGRDKALLDFDGQPLIDRAIAALAEVCGSVVVAGPQRPGVDAIFLADAPGEGPLAGIVAALRYARTPLVAVLAVDMPLASSRVFSNLAAAWHGEPAVAPYGGGSVQPLHAVYATSAADQLADVLEAGQRSPRAAVERLGGVVLRAQDYDPHGEAGEFWSNVNRPSDLWALAGRRARP